MELKLKSYITDQILLALNELTGAILDNDDMKFVFYLGVAKSLDRIRKKLSNMTPSDTAPK